MFTGGIPERWEHQPWSVVNKKRKCLTEWWTNTAQHTHSLSHSQNTKTYHLIVTNHNRLNNTGKVINHIDLISNISECARGVGGSQPEVQHDFWDSHTESLVNEGARNACEHVGTQRKRVGMKYKYKYTDVHSTAHTVRGAKVIKAVLTMWGDAQLVCTTPFWMICDERTHQ